MYCRLLIIVGLVFFGLTGLSSLFAGSTAEVNELLHGKKYQEATDMADELFRRDPSGAGVKKAAMLAAMAYARDLIKNKKAEEAIPVCERAEDYDMDSYRPHFYKGKALASLKRYDESRRALKRASELTDKAVVTWSLANVIYMQGDFEAAIPYYQKVLSQGKENARLLVNLGTSFWRTGDNYQALQFLKQALSKEPENAGIQKKIEKIEREESVQSGYRTVEQGDFTISFERSEEQRELKTKMAKLLKSALADVERDLWRHECDIIQVIIYPSGEAYKEAMDAPNWSAACWDGKLRIPLETARDADDDKLLPILRHELVHFLIRDKYKGCRIPGWIDEGLAQINEGRERYWAKNLLRKTINRRDAAKFMYPMKGLEPSFGRVGRGGSVRMAYAQALWIVKYLNHRRWSYPTDILYYVHQGETPEMALYKTTGDTYEKFTKKWLAWMRTEFHLPQR